MMGQHSLTAQDDPHRLATAQRRDATGVYGPIPVAQAVREVGEKLKDLVDRLGPRSVALYYGTGTAYSGLAYGMAKNWLRAIQSPELYTSMTLDASSLYVCMKRMGVFATGRPLHQDLDVLLLAGNNPVVSRQGWSKPPLPSSNPRKAIAEGQAKGTKLIVIDPRLTETARKADLFLQVRPGEDCTLLAGILRVMLERNWTDPSFELLGRPADDGIMLAVEPLYRMSGSGSIGKRYSVVGQVADRYLSMAEEGCGMQGQLSGTWLKGFSWGPHRTGKGPGTFPWQIDMRVAMWTDDGTAIIQHYMGAIARELVSIEPDADRSWRRTAIYETAENGLLAWLNGILAIGIGWKEGNEAHYLYYVVT